MQLLLNNNVGLQLLVFCVENGARYFLLKYQLSPND